MIYVKTGSDIQDLDSVLIRLHNIENFVIQNQKSRMQVWPLTVNRHYSGRVMHFFQVMLRTRTRLFFENVPSQMRALTEVKNPLSPF